MGCGSGCTGQSRNQVDDQAANCRVIEANHEIFVARRLPLALEVVAGLQDRPQRGVAQRRDADARDQPCDGGRLVQDDLDQFEVVRVEFALPDRGRACRRERLALRRWPRASPRRADSRRH